MLLVHFGPQEAARIIEAAASAVIKAGGERAMSSKSAPRVDYDRIASQYDSQPYRQKTVDAALATFLAQRPAAASLTVLDVACGTGNQLVANRAAYPALRMVGVDRFRGMLRQAQPKAATISWVQADGAALPFREQTFDFITCQFALHHMSDKTAMLLEVSRILRPNGCFVLTNICPQAMPDWLYYAYFPVALQIDRRDFWPPETVTQIMKDCGFQRVQIQLEHHRFTQDLRIFLATVRRRATCSQLVTMPDEAYREGLRRLERQVREVPGPCLRPDHLCVMTIRGVKG
jgi:ubiquinone/menaquinone biosynthesis C-methylase UbiE